MVGTFVQENNKLAGHVPMELSFLIFTFLRAQGKSQVLVTVTGGRILENGLVIPGSFRARTTSRQMGTKFEDELRQLKDICTHMDISVKWCIRQPVPL